MANGSEWLRDFHPFDLAEARVMPKGEAVEAAIKLMATGKAVECALVNGKLWSRQADRDDAN